MGKVKNIKEVEIKNMIMTMLDTEINNVGEYSFSPMDVEEIEALKQRFYVQQERIRKFLKI